MNNTRKRCNSACDFCRVRKRRCDGERPCSACREFNADCRYPPIKRVESPASNEAIVEQLNHIETLLEEHTQRLNDIFQAVGSTDAAAAAATVIGTADGQSTAPPSSRVSHPSLNLVPETGVAADNAPPPFQTNQQAFVGGGPQVLARVSSVSDYNVNFSPRDAHPGEQPQACVTTHHQCASLHHQATSTLHEPPEQHHPHYTSQYAMSHHPEQSPYGALGLSPHTVITPLYPSIAGPGGPQSLKRPRPDSLDLAVPGLSQVEQPAIESIQQTSLGAAYSQVASSTQQQLPIHYSYSFPDTGLPAQIMQRDTKGNSEGGGSGERTPSVVGQAGMPPPAPPRGPDSMYTPEDDQLLKDLVENKGLRWEQIGDFFPGRSVDSLQGRYYTYLKITKSTRKPARTFH